MAGRANDSLQHTCQLVPNSQKRTGSKMSGRVYA